MSTSGKDFGKRGIYNYHVNDTIDNRKVPFSVVNCWYPVSVKQEEIFILSKMKFLSNGRDGVYCEFSDVSLPLLLMTNNYRQLSNGRYEYDRDFIRSRTESRLHDFLNHNLLEGDLRSLAITFSGLRRLEDLVLIDESVVDNMNQCLLSVQECLRKINVSTESIDLLLRNFSHVSVKPKIDVGDIVSFSSDVLSIVSSVPSLSKRIPGLMDAIHNFLISI